MMTRQDAIQKVNELIRDIKIAMLVTENRDGELHALPMMTQEQDFDGDLWFFTESHSEKVEDIQRNSVVNVAYSEQGKYISVAGDASLVTDVQKKRDLWSEGLRVWFEAGPESPDVVLIKVNAQSAQYWDTPSGLLGRAASMIRVVLSGDKDAAGDSQKVTFK